MTKQSRRQSIIRGCKPIMLKILKIERGDSCELCGRHGNVHLFHILPISRFPRLQFHKRNLLLTDWHPCHYNWHHDVEYANNIVKPRIRELRGENYLEDLMKLDVISPKLSLFYLKTFISVLRLELKSKGELCI